MLQKNHHFLFPQTHFGSIESFTDELLDDEEEEFLEEEISQMPWVLVMESNTINPMETQIGLHIHWTDR